MIRSNCSVKFYIKAIEKQNTDGFPIYCRIIYQRKKSEFFTGEHIPEKKWDKNSGRPKRNSRLDEYLTKLKSRILEIKRELEYDKEEITPKRLKDLLKSKDKNERLTIIDYFNTQLEKYSKLKEEYAAGTIKKYKVAGNLLLGFVEYNKRTPLLKDVNYKFISDWDHYLVSYPEETNKSRSRNTANSYHKRLKKILGEAVREKKLESNPYESFPIKDQRVEKEALSKSELKQIIEHSLGGNPSLIKVRDIFLFTCFTGVRFQDGQNLLLSNIYKDSEGHKWLKYSQDKVKRIVEFPLLEAADQILEKYKIEQSITKKLLPRISNQKTNMFLKMIAELVGIDKKLTHHIARHTFASTILRENEIPMDVTKEWLGHSTGNDVTLLYAKLSKKVKLQYVEHLNEIVKVNMI